MRRVAFASLFFLMALAVRSQPAFTQISIKRDPYFAALNTTVAVRGQRAENRIQISGNRVTIRRNPLVRLIMDAYDVREFQVLHLPAWTRESSEVYDIEAQTPGDASPTLPAVQAMLRTLLADRFGLQVRRTSRSFSVYELVIASGGPKFSESTGPKPRDTTRYPPFVRFAATDKTMTDLVDFLEFTGARHVVDKTGLTGRYDFDLEYTPGADRTGESYPFGDGMLFHAVEHQLGLKLIPAREELETLVIEDVKKPKV